MNFINSFFNKNQNFDIKIKSHYKTVGFTSHNNYTLAITANNNDTVSSILSNINSFRSPQNQIRQLYDINGNPFSPSVKINDSFTFFINRK